ncbi:hypothetical protein [Streptomyces sp. NPDC001970]
MRRGPGATGLLTAVLLLSGCSWTDAATDEGHGTASSPPTTASPPPPPSRPPSSEPPSASPSPTAALTGKEEQLVAATLTGGIDGRHESVVVSGDGSYTRLIRGRTVASGRMEPVELAALRTALADADFPHLPRISMGEPVLDGRVYAIIHGGREVVTGDPAPPPALSKVIAALPFEAG